jgi:esterase/lipase superfamily enzyme
MMPAPRIYAAGCREPFAGLNDELKSSRAEVFYVTDRQPEESAEGRARYGHGRSWSAAYGRAVVEIGDDLSWGDLVRYSTTTPGFSRRPKLRIRTVEEGGRFPTTPYLFKHSGGRIVYSDETIAERQHAIERVREVIKSRFELTSRKEVFLFIHGVNTDFDLAIRSGAEAWHFFGRQGVPVVYTWPAKGGTPFSYGYDRESGEFTIYHLKQTLRVLSEIPEIEKIHILAHSRGTDITLAALRELVIEARAAGTDSMERLHIYNVALLAADLDIDVASQRVVAEALGPSIGKVTVYINESDKALAVARTLFSSRIRLGDMSPSKLSEHEKTVLKEAVNADFVIFDGKVAGAYGHRYFQENPAVSSDVILTVRDGLRPGAEHGRPLEPYAESIWLLHDDYLDDPDDSMRAFGCAVEPE